MPVRLIRPSSLLNLGILTPQVTLNRANVLMNAFNQLQTAVFRLPVEQEALMTRQLAELRPVMNGWISYYMRIKNNLIERAAEYGQLAEWEKEYMRLRSKFASEGTDVSTAPIIMSGGTPGLVPPKVEVEAEEAARRVGEEVEEAGRETVEELERLWARVLLGGAAILMVGAGVLWLVGRAKE